MPTTEFDVNAILNGLAEDLYGKTAKEQHELLLSEKYRPYFPPVFTGNLRLITLEVTAEALLKYTHYQRATLGYVLDWMKKQTENNLEITPELIEKATRSSLSYLFFKPSGSLHEMKIPAEWTEKLIKALAHHIAPESQKVG